MPFYEILWNEEPDGNVRHIAEHDLTPQDIEAVIFHPVDRDVSIGQTIMVVFRSAKGRSFAERKTTKCDTN